MYIVDPSVEDGVDEVRQKIEGIITGREGVVISYDKLGKKRLAYTIAKRQYGVYYLVNLKGTGKIVQALEYYLRLSPVVLRYIILVFSEKELALRERTSVVQLEEAERMRAGGRPIPGKSDEDALIPPEAAATLEEVAAEVTVDEPSSHGNGGNDVDDQTENTVE
jgi:small subunit ribosomal protein S6